VDKVFRFVVNKPYSRLDKCVRQQYRELSRTYIQKLIGGGCVTVNNDVVRASLKLNSGDKVKITFPTPTTIASESIPLNITYENDDLMVIDKPAGLTVHPAPGHPDHTLVNALLYRLPSLFDGDDLLRPGIVHRLDKDTSGVMVVAKNSRARIALVDQFRAHSVVKGYQVLVKGRLTPEDGVIEAPIGRDSCNRKRMAIVNEGKEARTRYHVIEYLDNYTLLNVRPVSGLTLSRV
jgi:23S rRNA pseudouridine1911/1915/1917 synthase